MEAKEGETQRLPNRRTCHLAGPPVYEPLLSVASERVTDSRLT